MGREVGGRLIGSKELFKGKIEAIFSGKGGNNYKEILSEKDQ